jgi:hypothetical protein
MGVPNSAQTSCLAHELPIICDILITGDCHSPLLPDSLFRRISFGRSALISLRQFELAKVSIGFSSLFVRPVD